MKSHLDVQADSNKPCYRCKSTNRVAQRHKVAFHIMLWSGLLLTVALVGALLLIAMIWIPKKIYCDDCGAMITNLTEA